MFALLLGTAIAGAGSDEGLDDSQEEETVCRHETYRASEEKEIRYVELSDSCHAKQLVQRMRCVNPDCAHEATVVLKEVLERHQWKNVGDGHYNGEWLHAYWR